MEVAGQLVQGGQNIFFAQLADPSTVPVSYTHLDVYKRQNLYRSNSEAERKNPDARRLSRTSGDGGSIRSNGRSRRTADAREDITAERCKDRQCSVSESDTSNPGGRCV